jgi:hypothetical protein
MSRLVLLAVLFVLGAAAHGMNPVRHGPNGSATCPESQLPVDIDEDQATEAAVNGPIAPATATPVPVNKPAAATRPKTGARWHSFLPGMFK